MKVSSTPTWVPSLPMGADPPTSIARPAASFWQWGSANELFLAMTINSDGETLPLAACGVNRIIPVCLGNFGPVVAGNHIVCIDDANTFIEPESYSRTSGLAYRTLLPLIGKRASRVATVPDAV